MAINAPVVEWYNVDNAVPANSNKVVVSQPFDFGVIDAGYTPTPADYYSFLIWNNRNNLTDIAPQMEEVTIGIKDSAGGNGATVGSEVWAINGTTKWFYAKVDSLGETDANFAMIGADVTKGIGTNGSTTNPAVKNAVAWSASLGVTVGVVVKPTSDNGYVYKVTTAGTTGSTEPAWNATEDAIVTDNGVEYIAIKKVKAPSANNIILGGLNSSNPTANPNWATESGGNYSKVTLKIEAPISAQSGRQDIKVRVSYRFI